jgi:SAM-dependent methyltransferase
LGRSHLRRIFVEPTDRQPCTESVAEGALEGGAAQDHQQDFDGRGDSKSAEKLKALRLDDLAVLTERDPTCPLKGLAVLDLGCNEGYFCVEAVRQGASRVVGIDANAAFIDAARARCPEATFLNTSWWNIPDERFDVVLFLSTMHYESDPKGLFDRIARHLTPSGRLILECGVFTDRTDGDFRAWRTVKRADDVRRYPTSDLLVRDLLSSFAVRYIGPSVVQAGDPVLRYVYHCGTKAPVALLVAAPGGSGKTTLSVDLDVHGIPTYATDMLLWRLARDPRHAWRPLAELIRTRFPDEGQSVENSIFEIGVLIAESGRGGDLAEIIVEECPREVALFCIQGDALRHESILAQIVSRLQAISVRTWIVKPS